MKLNITNDVTSADLEQLRKNLISYNVPHFEPVDEKPLGIFYDDDAGVRRAGLAYLTLERVDLFLERVHTVEQLHERVRLVLLYLFGEQLRLRSRGPFVASEIRELRFLRQALLREGEGCLQAFLKVFALVFEFVCPSALAVFVQEQRSRGVELCYRLLGVDVLVGGEEQVLYALRDFRSARLGAARLSDERRRGEEV